MHVRVGQIVFAGTQFNWPQRASIARHCPKMWLATNSFCQRGSSFYIIRNAPVTFWKRLHFVTTAQHQITDQFTKQTLERRSPQWDSLYAQLGCCYTKVRYLVTSQNGTVGQLTSSELSGHNNWTVYMITEQFVQYTLESRTNSAV